MDYENIRERYLKNYITDAQLDRFLALGVITQKQRDALYAEKHPAEQAEEEK